MINEDKVKELYQMALYDEKKDKDCRNTGRYFEGDYIGKQIFISFITGTIGFICIFAIWAIVNIEVVQAFMAKFNTENIAYTFTLIGLLYLAFLLAYMFITVVFYIQKYKKGRKELKKYANHLKCVNKMYDRDEKLKS